MQALFVRIQLFCITTKMWLRVFPCRTFRIALPRLLFRGQYAEEANRSVLRRSKLSSLPGRQPGVAAFFQSPALLHADRAAADAWLVAHGRADGLSAFAARCCRLLLPPARDGIVAPPDYPDRLVRLSSEVGVTWSGRRPVWLLGAADAGYEARLTAGCRPKGWGEGKSGHCQLRPDGSLTGGRRHRRSRCRAPRSSHAGGVVCTYRRCMLSLGSPPTPNGRHWQRASAETAARHNVRVSNALARQSSSRSHCHQCTCHC